MFLGVEKKVWKRVWALAFPAMLGQISTIIYNLADTYFISLTNDPLQIAAVTVSLPIFVIVMAIANIYSMGGCSMMSRAYGSGDTDRVRTVTVLAIYGIVVTSIVIGIAGFLLVRPISMLAGADETCIDFTVTYLRYIFIGAPAVMLGNGMAGIFRGHNFAKASAAGMILGNVINVILDFVFIVLMHRGIAGASVATVLGSAGACVYYLVVIFKKNLQGNKMITLSPKAFHPTAEMVREMFRVGTPSTLLFIFVSAATMIINNFVGLYGASAIAAYGIAIKLNNVAVNLGNGLAQGVSPRFGFCYGAKDKKGLDQTLRAALLYGSAGGLLFLGLFLFAGRQLSKLFLSDPVLIGEANLFLIILTSTTFLGICIAVFAAYFQTIGKAMPSTLIVLLKNIILFVPALILMNAVLGLYGVIAAFPVAEVITMVISLFLYRKYKKQIMREMTVDA